MALGLPCKPKPWIWIRPEVRYDWTQFQDPYNDGTRGSQLPLAFEIIIQFRTRACPLGHAVGRSLGLRMVVGFV